MGWDLDEIGEWERAAAQCNCVCPEMACQCRDTSPI